MRSWLLRHLSPDPLRRQGLPGCCRCWTWPQPARVQVAAGGAHIDEAEIQEDHPAGGARPYYCRRLAYCCRAGPHCCRGPAHHGDGLGRCPRTPERVVCNSVGSPPGLYAGAPASRNTRNEVPPETPVESNRCVSFEPLGVELLFARIERRET